MQVPRSTLAIFFLCGSLSTAFAVAQTAREVKPAAPAAPKNKTADGTTEKGPIYKPPVRGAPSGRVGSGARGAVQRSVVLAALTPDHLGLTTREQPVLFWYLSQPTADPIYFTLSENRALKPTIEAQLSVPSQSGIQRIRLADLGVRLKTGVEYHWFVAVVPDRDNRSKDIVAGGFIERIEPSAKLRASLSRAAPAQLAMVYAEEGIWYDALAAVSDKIDATPGDAVLRSQRAALLDQIRLQEVADFDRRASGQP